MVAGRFAIEDVAGRGGMGTVYRASDSSTGRLVALKLLHATTSQQAAMRFNREAVLLEGLHHPAIVSYVAHGAPRTASPTWPWSGSRGRTWHTGCCASR